MKGKAIVAGHICIDIAPVFPERPRQESLTELLSPGKLIHMRGVDVHTGGAVANTGLAMKRLGADVRLVGKIGQDALGSLVSAVLKKHRAEGDLIADAAVATSYSVVLAIPGIDRIFLHDPGANDRFWSEDIKDSVLEGAELFHFGYPPLMRSVYEAEGAELIKLFKRVKARGLVTSLDMAAVDPNSDAGKADWLRLLQALLPYVDHFVPSVEELCYMLDRERYAEWNRRARGGDVTAVLDVEADIVPLAERLLAMGAQSLLIKCGAPGLYYAEGAEQGFLPSYKAPQLVSGTGAGDASIAGYLTALLKGLPPRRRAQLAAACGACSVSAADAISGLRDLAELERMIEAGWSPDYCPPF